MEARTLGKGPAEATPHSQEHRPRPTARAHPQSEAPQGYCGVPRNRQLCLCFASSRSGRDQTLIHLTGGEDGSLDRFRPLPKELISRVSTEQA